MRKKQQQFPERISPALFLIQSYLVAPHPENRPTAISSSSPAKAR